MAAETAEGREAEPPDADALWRLLGLARRRAGLVAVSAAFCAVLATLVLLLQPPTYRATAELLVAPQALQVVGRDIVRSDSSAALDSANIDSQSSVMLSTAVLRRVASELDLAADPAFQPRTGLLPRLLARLAPAPALSPAQREAEVLELLKASLVVRRVEGALVFQVTASHPRAARAAEIANALASGYLRATAQERVDSVRRADASIIAQVAGLREQLDAADAAAERYRGANGLVKSSPDGLVVTQQLKDLYTQIDAAAAEAARLAARKDQVAKLAPEALLTDSVPEALNSPTLVALRAGYANLAREAASQARTLLPQHPRMLELNAELAEARKQLRAELVRLRASVSDAAAQADGSLAKLQARAQELTRSKNSSGEADIRLRQLESEAGAIRSVFDASLARARELEQQGKIQTSNSRLLSEATPPMHPTKPPLPVVAAGAALVGALLGLGLAGLLERLPPRRAAPPGVHVGAAARGVAAVPPVERPTPLTAREAGALLGTGAIVLPRPGRFRGAGTAAVAETLEPVAAGLRTTLGGRLPSLVAVVTVGAGAGPRGTPATAEALGQALADLGERVLFCAGGTLAGEPAQAPVDGPPGGPAVRRIEGRGAVTAAGLGRAAPVRGEFVIAAVDLGRADAAALAAARSADAVVLAADLAAVDPDALLAAVRTVDPSRRRLAALLVEEVAAPRRAPMRALAAAGRRGGPPARWRATA